MKWNKKFEYPKSQREIFRGHRHYNVSDEKLPSVTSILGQTQSEEKRKKLAALDRDWETFLFDF